MSVVLLKDYLRATSGAQFANQIGLSETQQAARQIIKNYCANKTFDSVTKVSFFSSALKRARQFARDYYGGDIPQRVECGFLHYLTGSLKDGVQIWSDPNAQAEGLWTDALVKESSGLLLAADSIIVRHQRCDFTNAREMPNNDVVFLRMLMLNQELHSLPKSRQGADRIRRSMEQVVWPECNLAAENKALLKSGKPTAAKSFKRKAKAPVRKAQILQLPSCEERPTRPTIEPGAAHQIIQYKRPAVQTTRQIAVRAATSVRKDKNEKKPKISPAFQKALDLQKAQRAIKAIRAAFAVVTDTPKAQDRVRKKREPKAALTNVVALHCVS